MSCFQTLREQGYRLTPQRVLVIEAIHDAESHISAEEIYAQVRSTAKEGGVIEIE